MIDDLPPLSDRELRLLALSDRAEGYTYRGRRPRSERRGVLGRVPIPMSAEQIETATALRRSGKCWSAIAKVLHIAEERVRREFGAPKLACRLKARRAVR